MNNSIKKLAQAKARKLGGEDRPEYYRSKRAKGGGLAAVATYESDGDRMGRFTVEKGARTMKIPSNAKIEEYVDNDLNRGDVMYMENPYTGSRRSTGTFYRNWGRGMTNKGTMRGPSRRK